ncbi:uncharacterized protein LOC127866398 isoform X1 [Dreissena polymorpha]|nr:uncharacterized protein LOC127866398 isoform X1 [Dreissena polymorpha]
MQAICVFIAVIAACHAGTTTHRPHVTHTTHAHVTHTTHAHVTHTTLEPGETDTLSFQFLPTTLHLLVKTHPDKTTYNCYIAALSDSEHAQIHTDAGMTAVELRVLAALGSATAVTDASTLDKRDVNACGHMGTLQTHFFTITV